MTVLHMNDRRFKKAVYVSIAAHAALVLVFVISPYLPNFSKNKGTIYYVNYMGGGGGGGGGGGNPPQAKLKTATEEIAETPAPQRQTLKDLTVPENLETRTPKLVHPVDKPKRTSKSKPNKQSVIQKSRNTAGKKPAEKKSGGSTSSGPGLSIGNIVGGSGGGTGTGSGFGPGTGPGNFPFSYYFDQIIASVSSNWLKSRIRSGISGSLTTKVTFRIYRDGSKGSVSVKESCGSRALDNSALRAVQQAKFPPLPPALEDDYVVIDLVFEHN